MPLSLKQLRYFVAIADAGAMSRAAETLSIAQSALSHHVAEMEASLGVSLLDRSMDLPGYKFHPLKGNRAGEYAVTVTGNVRITFRFDSQHAIAVNLEDYH